MYSFELGVRKKSTLCSNLVEMLKMFNHHVFILLCTISYTLEVPSKFFYCMFHLGNGVCIESNRRHFILPVSTYHIGYYNVYGVTAQRQAGDIPLQYVHGYSLPAETKVTGTKGHLLRPQKKKPFRF